MTEERPQYLIDAAEMMGASIEIEPPREVMVRRGEKTAIEERAAFVKISTAFKDSGELKKIDEISLKVWLFIALSVNRETGRAHPGLRTIANGTGFAINTIRAAIERLEKEYGLLAVYRGEKKYNIYEPTAFVSARRETVSPDDTSVSDKAQSVSVEGQSVSAKDESVSPRVILNQRTRGNQRNQNKPDSKKFDFSKSDISWTVLAGEAVTEEQIARLQSEQSLLDEYERAMGYNPLPWTSPKLDRLRQFLITKSAEEIQTFAAWSRRPYSSFSPAKARSYPEQVKDNWPQAFMVEQRELTFAERLARA